MADYLLDTNILSFWYDKSCQENARVVARAAVVKQPDPITQYVPRLFISVITLGEIEYGSKVSRVPNPTKQAQFNAMDAAKIKFVRDQCPVAIEIDEHVTVHYGELRAWIFNRFSPRNKRSNKKRAEELVNPSTGMELGIDENDIWIAAQAINHNLVLVTHDSRGNFGTLLQQFNGSLIVEDWTM